MNKVFLVLYLGSDKWLLLKKSTQITYNCFVDLNLQCCVDKEKVEKKKSKSRLGRINELRGCLSFVQKTFKFSTYFP